MGKGKGGVGGFIKGGGGLGAYAQGGMNFVGELSGANAAARAAQRAAEAQQAAAHQTRQDVLNYGQKYEQDMMNLAAASPRELQALSQSFSAAEQNLNREQRLLEAIDPALMEASKQALSLLRGDSAAMNNPLNAQRASQREALVNSLRAQYGPGAESTSIGLRALQQFDLQSNSMLAQNQQSALGQAFGIATSDVGGRSRQALGQLMGVGQGYGAIQERQMNARQAAGAGMLGALSGTSQQIINSAGAQYTGDALRANAQMGFFNQAVGIGSMIAGNKAGALPKQGAG